MCVTEIGEKPRLGYRVIGAVTAGAGSDVLSVAGVPVLGSFDRLPALIRQYGIEGVMIAETELSPQALFEAVMRCGRTHHINFRVVPNLFNSLPRKTDVGQVGSLPMIKLFEEPLSGPARFVKRSVDIAGAVVSLVATAPAWAFLAYLIKRESPGPVFKTQERVGMDGKIFPMIKFRSMVADADSPEKVAAHRESMRQNIASGEDEASDELFGKVKDDPRITRIGGWMRRFSVDEWPQVVNVLRGEMSSSGHGRRFRTRSRCTPIGTARGFTRSRGSPGCGRFRGRTGCRSSRWSSSTCTTSRTGRCGWTSRSC